MASEKIINFMVNFLSNCCCQIRVIFQKRLGLLFIIPGFLFLRPEHLHGNIFRIKIYALNSILYHVLLSSTILAPDWINFKCHYKTIELFHF